IPGLRSALAGRIHELRVKLAVELDGTDGVVAENDLGLRSGCDEERANSYGDCVPFHFSSSEKKCSAVRNCDLEHGTAAVEATSDASWRQVHASFCLACTRWRSAAICGNATLPSV